jgi:hypothetical protein
MKTCFQRFFLLVVVLLVASPMLLSQTDTIKQVYRSQGHNTKDSLLSGGGRSILAGVDLNKNGKKEVYVTQYVNKTVIMMEVTGNDTMELKQVFPTPKVSSYATEPRDVQYGDLDKDGNMEIIYPIGRTVSDSSRGYHVYEWSPDSGKFLGPYIVLPDPSMIYFRPENFLVNDVDGDGQDEIVDLGFGFANGNDDHVRIISISGTFEGGFSAPVVEYSLATGNFQNGRDFATVTAAIADVDGDGKKEIWLFGNNRLGSNTTVMNIRATGANTYTADTTKIAVIQSTNQYPLKSVATADYNKDGKDEVYFDIFGGASGPNRVYVIGNLTNAANFDSTNIYRLYSLDSNVNKLHARAYYGMRSSGRNNSPIYIAGYYTIEEFSYKGTGSVTDSASYNMRTLFVADSLEYALLAGITGGFWYTGNKPGTDLDGDNKAEILASFQGLLDTNAAAHRPLRMFEFTKSTVGVKEWVMITPDDYKLEQNYPNPFNPSTKIAFTLPVNNKISLKVYDILGKEVRTLINGEDYVKGSHSVMWDGKNNFGASVASGTYIYKLIFNTFEKSMKMMLLK